jgi:uncharacterized integral membrane protein
VVNITILFYQIGLCSVAVLFIADNLKKVMETYVDIDVSLTYYATIALAVVICTNMVTELRVRACVCTHVCAQVISVFAMLSTIFFLLGTVAILIYSFTQPNKWQQLPAYTNFFDTITFIGMAMYSFEGQTMVRAHRRIHVCTRAHRSYQSRTNCDTRRISDTTAACCRQPCRWRLCC